ncbi:MAG: FAD:protein FMN transferase [Gammaproteobacteria bacterium]
MRVQPATLLLGALLLAGCAGDDAQHTHTFTALGTLIVVEIHGPDGDMAALATTAVEDRFRQIGHEWYAWGSGELGRINAALARGEPAPVSAELGALIRRALAVRDLSDGYFDPAVGSLVESWGFHDTNAGPVTPPGEAWLAEWRSTAAQRAGLTVDHGVVRAPGPMKIALGGIAKGTALTIALQLLRDYGIENALIDAGGDLAAIGSKDGRAWRVGIRDPAAADVLGVVDLEPGEAIVSSGNYERYFEDGGRCYHHLLDPHSGLPVEHTAGVTVIHDDAELADAAATALMAAGPERFMRLTARLGIGLAMLVTTNGDIVATPAMRDRLDPTATNAARWPVAPADAR